MLHLTFIHHLGSLRLLIPSLESHFCSVNWTTGLKISCIGEKVNHGQFTVKFHKKWLKDQPKPLRVSQDKYTICTRRINQILTLKGPLIWIQLIWSLSIHVPIIWPDVSIKTCSKITKGRNYLSRQTPMDKFSI